MAPLVAKEKGYWTQEGLTTVDLTVVGPAPTHMAAMIGGAFDFSINLTTDTLARSNAQGEKVYAVAGSSNAPTYSLFGKGVSEVADLKGKVIATDAPGGTGELLTLDILSKHGLSKSDVNLVPVAGTVEEREQAMLTGVASGALGSSSDLPRLADSGVVELAKMTEVYADYQTAVTAGRGAFLDEHPDTSVAFLKGLIRGFAYVQDPAHTDEIRQILEKNDVAVDAKHWADTLALQRQVMTVDGSINVKGADVVLVREREAKRVPADYTAQQLIRADALDKAQNELGL
jgi:ABC-type nitrate/sulfonate/bicarbonate transport system substrate-binding protein